MLLNRRLLDSAGGGGGGSVVEMPTSFATRGDIEKGFESVKSSFKRLEDRYGKLENFNPDDFANLRKQVTDLLAGQAAFAEDWNKKLTSRVDLGGGDASFLTRVSSLVLPYQPDEEFKDFNRTYFNLIAYHPEELTYAATAAQFNLGGMSPSLQRHLRSGAQPFDSFRAQVGELQSLNDAIYLMDVILCGPKHDTAYARKASGDPLARMKTLKLWKQWEHSCDMFGRAIAAGGTVATGAYGGAWLPQMFSAQMHDLVQISLGVAGLFPSLDMPGKVYTSPVLLLDGIAYLVPENPTSQGGALASGTVVPESTPQTTNMTLTAVKLASRMGASDDAQEDLLVPIIPFLLTQLAKATARALDQAVLNGDAQTTHIDAGAAADAPTTPTDARKAWDGLRALVLKNSGMPLIDITANTDAVFFSMKSGMGAFGINPSEGAWVTSMVGLFKMMQLTDGNNNKLFVRADTLGGQNTTLLTGQLGALMGSPIVVSEFSPDDTQGTTGIRLSANAKSTVVYAHRPSLQRGQRRVFTVQRSSERYIEYLQDVLVSSWRGDFKPWFTVAAGANKLVAVGRNY